ncbi:MAG: hypothetical protein H6656_18475 [Ardenticatenaceae bacterium]|nr:hypothetical protein [Ardenticatenaceae bacterium]
MDMVAKLSGRQKGIVGLTVATAVIHLILGIQFGNVLFILNFLGYLALVAGLYFLPQLASQQAMLRWALVGYTALTIILYFVMNPDAFTSGLGLVTKAIEVILIILLVMDK